MTRRKPEKRRRRHRYGRRVANALAGFDIGQSVAICERACVAVEAMEGTDAMLRRAASWSTDAALTLVKVARRREHLLFDVPVVGSETIAVMRETGDHGAGRGCGTHPLARQAPMLAAANAAGIAIIGSGRLNTASYHEVVPGMRDLADRCRHRRRAVRTEPLPRRRRNRDARS